jgi:lysophospholipase L1-like esterase
MRSVFRLVMMACFLSLSLVARAAQAQSHPALLSCYVMGDSIAVGTAQKLPWCGSNAKVGLNTKQALTRYPQLPAVDVMVISLGINDRGSRLPTVQNLVQLRKRMVSPRVIWILPNDATKVAQIEQVANAFHDMWIDMNSPGFDRYLSHVDHLHPNGTGYAMVAHRARELAWLGIPH